MELLAERGLAAMSIEEVAARAGVGKTTIYRRWPSKGLLALDAFVASFREEQPLPDTGTLRGDLLAALHAWVRAVTQTPMGSMLSLSTGDAFDVKVKPVVVKRTAISLFRWQTTMKYTLTNALPKTVTVDLMQDGLGGDTRIVSESQKSDRTNAYVATWHVQVPANGNAQVDAVFDTRF